MSTKNKTRNDQSSDKRKKPKQKVVRKEQKEAIELPSPAHIADSPDQLFPFQYQESFVRYLFSIKYK